MANSKINPEYKYELIKTLEEDDKGLEAPLYHIELFGKRVSISVSQNPIDDPKNSNILAYPIYLINTKMDKVVNRIGYYEFDSTNGEPEKDDKDDIIIDNKNQEPVIFDYVTMEDYQETLEKNIVSTKYLQEQLEEKSDEEDDEDEESEEAKETVQQSELDYTYEELKQKVNIKKAGKIKNQKLVDAKQELEESPQGPWIKRFMKNRYYDIQKVTGDGSCFFWCLAHSILNIIDEDVNDGNLKYIVDLLRNNVSSKIDSDKVEMYKTNVKLLEDTIKDINDNIKEIAKKLKTNVDGKMAWEKKSKTGNDPNNFFKKFTKKVDSYEKKLKEAEAELQKNKDELESQFGWFKNLMKGTKNDNDLLIKLKGFVKTKEFWADEWVLELFKSELKIRITLFNKYNYVDGMDHNEENRNLITCNKGDGDENDKPNYYIFLEYSKDHYNLITYKDKNTFRFEEIPYYLKLLLINDWCYGNEPDFLEYIEMDIIDNLDYEDEDEAEQVTEVTEEVDGSVSLDEEGEEVDGSVSLDDEEGEEGDGSVSLDDEDNEQSSAPISQSNVSL